MRVIERFEELVVKVLEVMGRVLDGDEVDVGVLRLLVEFLKSPVVVEYMRGVVRSGIEGGEVVGENVVKIEDWLRSRVSNSK